MSENDIKPVAWTIDEQLEKVNSGRIGFIAIRDLITPAADVPLYDQSGIDRLLEKIDRLEMIESSWLEFMEKTEWVQKSSDPGELGLHRADVLKSRIDRLTAELTLVSGERNRLQIKWDEFRQTKNAEIQRLTEERDEAMAAVASKAGWEWKKRADKAEAERDAAVAALDRIVSLKMSMFKDPYDMIGECVNIAAEAIEAAMAEAK